MLVFQVLNWFAADVEVDDGDSGDDVVDSEAPYDPETYFIKMFGVDANGQSVSATVCGFEPHFYVKLERPWSLRQIETFVEAVRCKMPRKWSRASINARALSKKDFWGFSNGRTFPFLRLAFKSERAMRAAARVLSKPLGKITGHTQRTFKLYESNISALLRFAHIRDLPSVGWVRVANEKRAEILPSRCKTDVQVNWKHVEPVRDRDNIAPFVIASFDIECNSSDGDFPVARKGYQKIANDLYNMNATHAPADFAKRAAALVRGVFESGAVVPFGSVEMSAVEDKMYQIADHVRVLASGDTAMLKVAMRDKFLDVFEKGGLECFEQCVAFFEKISATSTSSAALRRAVHTWLKKCFANRQAQLTFAARGNQEDIVEELVRYLLKDKDAVVSTLAKYLDATLPRLKGDEIIQIGTTFHRYGETEVSRRVLLSLGVCGAVAGTEVIVCDTEAELLTKWCELIEEADPEVVTGYNILGFDFAYIYERGVELGCAEEFDRLGRLLEFGTSFKESKLSSSALGDNILRYLDMHGRTIIDLMKVVQRDHKLDSYKLDAVASHFMKMNKQDVSPQQIFDLYKRGNPEDRAKIADYCIQDCALCNKLVMKLEIVANNVGMAKVCSVPLSYIFMRGQGVKIFSLIAKECKAKGYLIPVVSKGDDTEEDAEGYEGAIVLEPKTGIYIDTPIAVLDYASLYPSSMISENLSHDCLVLDEKYDNLEGVDYLDVSYDLYDHNEDGDKVKVGEKVCRYAQPKSGDESTRGILPTILVYLLKQRKLTRKRIEAKRVTLADGRALVGFYKDGAVYDVAGNSTAVDPAEVVSVEDAYSAFEKATLDGLQQAYKVTANSLYGQMGARTSPMYLKDIAACTTATGRKMILLAKEFLEKEYKADIVYGDSVTGNTPVVVKRPNGQLDVVAIQDLGREWRPIADRSFVKAGDGKEEAFVEAMVWCNGEWAQVARVIRHKTQKTIYRVNSAHGSVDVTEDHSLIAEGGDNVSPKEIVVGETRIAGDLSGIENSSQCYDRFFELGVRFAEMADVHRCGEAAFARLRSVLNACVATKAAFVDGFWDKSTGVLHTSSLRFAQYVYLITKCVDRVGYQTLVSRDPDTAGLVTLQRKLTLLPMNNVVESVTRVANHGEYVYDIETTEGVFHGGVGEMLLKNTDSLFVHFPGATEGCSKLRGALEQTIDLGKQASDAIKPILKPPHDLEYEKTFWPFILFSKKRYVANQYGTDPNKFKQTSMGIVLKRRDNANIVKRVYGGVIDIILNKHDVGASVSFLRETLADLVQGKFPLEELIISKTLKAHYKDPSRIAHKVLADRIKERSPGSAPQVNDRIPYVYVYNPNSKKLLQGDRIEHPDYIREKDLQPDYEFYITNQVMNPVLQLYAIVLEQLEGYGLAADHWDRLAKQLESEGKTPSQVRDRVTTLRENEVKRLLFDPILKRIADDPERKMLVNKSNGNRTITEWFKPKRERVVLTEEFVMEK